MVEASAKFMKSTQARSASDGIQGIPSLALRACVGLLRSRQLHLRRVVLPAVLLGEHARREQFLPLVSVHDVDEVLVNVGEIGGAVVAAWADGEGAVFIDG